MQNQPVPTVNDSNWVISPLLPTHVSLLTSWIGFLDPNNAIDLVAIEAQLSKGISEADAEGSIEHRIGFFQELPVFYLVGRTMPLSKSFKILRTTGPNLGYEISTLLINPVIEQGLILPIYYHAIKSIFESHHALRIIIPVEMHHLSEICALKAIGFNLISFGGTPAHYQWFGLRKLDFVAF